MLIVEERLIDAAIITDAEHYQEHSIRPQKLSDYTGQTVVCEQMDLFISAAKKRGEALDHVLIF